MSDPLRDRLFAPEEEKKPARATKPKPIKPIVTAGDAQHLDVMEITMRVQLTWDRGKYGMHCQIWNGKEWSDTVNIPRWVPAKRVSHE